MGRPPGPQLEKQRIKVMPGQRYGFLTVICEADAIHLGKRRCRMVKCRCDCGQIVKTRLEYLRSGHTKSCGCARHTISAKAGVTHGKTKTRLYGVWAGMLNRCRNKNVKSYKHYGAKGVKVCREWYDFENFYNWATQNGYRDNLTIDRIDPFGNYEPNNCRWIPKSEQSRNRRDRVGVRHA